MSLLHSEIEGRTLAWHPPISRQILFEFELKNESEVNKLANEFRNRLISHWTELGLHKDEVRIAGPAPAALEKLRGKFRIHLCVSALKKHLPRTLVPKDILVEKMFLNKVRCDVDPQSFL